MKTQEWQKLQSALGACLNGQGTLHYNYDARLSQLIEPYAPDNGYPYVKTRDYSTKNREETLAAIENWVKEAQRTEDTHITTLAQIQFGDEGYDETSKEKIIPQLLKEHKLLERGVVDLFPEEPKGFVSDMRTEYVGGLFELAWAAIEEFKKSPVAFVRFPRIKIQDSRVFGGFYGSPWSNAHNNRTLCMKFREVNHHFEVRVCTTSEWGEYGSKRELGVLFTYRNPWSS